MTDCYKKLKQFSHRNIYVAYTYNNQRNLICKKQLSQIRLLVLDSLMLIRIYYIMRHSFASFKTCNNINIEEKKEWLSVVLHLKQQPSQIIMARCFFLAGKPTAHRDRKRSRWPEIIKLCPHAASNQGPTQRGAVLFTPVWPLGRKREGMPFFDGLSD